LKRLRRNKKIKGGMWSTSKNIINAFRGKSEGGWPAMENN
jgi:hypothetical protein